MSFEGQEGSLYLQKSERGKEYNFGSAINQTKDQYFFTIFGGLFID